ncbi:MAG: ribosome small subunit-dependent GTPase A [Oscillospiraceae bacterium]|nr:ribosome small subunit-dependent GTPase A [Oscillospiraceae bacterium]
MSAGTLVKYVGGLGTVLLDDGQILGKVALRGIFRHDEIKPLVGDKVCVSCDDSVRIDEILPRRNVLVRPPIANVDCLVMVLSEAPPKSDPMLADSLTVTAECYGIDVVIAVNKSDIDEGKHWQERYAASGYPVFAVSAETGSGIAGLKTVLCGKIVVLAGKSGVGKSSLLNALFPDLALQTGEISERLKLGKHTTRHVELISCDCNTKPSQEQIKANTTSSIERQGDSALSAASRRSLIADTPGFTIYDPTCIKGKTPGELAYCYPEMRPYIDQCRYRSCRHERDEGCAILQAVQDGKISPERHATYVALLAAL